MNLSIRFRLTLWYSAVLLAALALFAAAMSVALEHRLMAGLETRLAQRVEGLRTVAGEAVVEHMSRQLLQEELVEFTREVPEGTLTALADPNAIEAPDFTDPSRWIAIGYSALWRVLFVVYTEVLPGGRTRIIGARNATTVQRRKYEEAG